MFREIKITSDTKYKNGKLYRLIKGVDEKGRSSEVVADEQVVPMEELRQKLRMVKNDIRTAQNRIKDNEKIIEERTLEMNTLEGIIGE